MSVQTYIRVHELHRGRFPAARRQLFRSCCCCRVSSGELGVQPASDLFLSHQRVIVSSGPSGDYLLLLCKVGQVPTCTFIQLSELTAAVQNTMFPDTDTALMRNVGQHENSPRDCVACLITPLLQREFHIEDCGCCE